MRASVDHVQFHAISALLIFLLASTHQESKCDAIGKPLKVYILVGQSNMQGHAHQRTLPHLLTSPKTEEFYHSIVSRKGTPKQFENIRIAYLNNGATSSGALTVGYGANEEKFGPELNFGIYMQQKLNEPILIIKAAWGGKSIHTDFRSPGAGPFEFEKSTLERLRKLGKEVSEIENEKREKTGVHYRLTINHVKSILADIKSFHPSYNPKNGYTLAGVVWFQGWNDMVDSNVYPQRDQPEGYRNYTRCLTHFIQDIRQEFNSPAMPFVIGVMGVGGPTNHYTKRQQKIARIHQNFRDAMAAPANVKDVIAVYTEKFWDKRLENLFDRSLKIKNSIRKLAKDGLIKSGERQAKIKAMMNEEFSKSELHEIDSGISNAPFHYLGSSKIMAQVGKSFADAMPVNPN